jgi:hypothetical protein
VVNRCWLDVGEIEIDARVEENTAADGVILTPDQLQRLDNITPATGARHDGTNMASIDR